MRLHENIFFILNVIENLNNEIFFMTHDLGKTLSQR